MGLVGLSGHLVAVEAHLAASLPGFTLVGLPDASLAEARDRVRAAVLSSGVPWPQRRITVNLSPASLPKAGAGFDLAIALALLAAAGACDPAAVAGAVHVGELGLDGRLRAVRGVLPAVVAAVASGRPTVVVPRANAAEAALVPGADVRAAGSLAEVLARYGADVPVPELEDDHPEGPNASAPTRSRARTSAPDLADVLGQSTARYGLEVAAAGGHHLLMLGPPGAGKTMLAERLPGLLPDLSDDDAVEVTAVHSVAGTFRPDDGLIRRPPFEDPHHTATPAAVIGGGSGLPRPGAASRAHRGVLFMDEAPEFSPRVLETLRQPLEKGELVIQRAGGAARFPARFQLVLAANPCPCGRAVGRGLDCTCSALARRRYLGRLSGPLLDRIDIQLEVLPVRRAEVAAADDGLGVVTESTAQVASRVASARAAARGRLSGTPWATNAEVPGTWLRQRTSAAARADVERALDRGALTLRGADRVLRVAWTVSDLAGRGAPDRGDVGRALLLRSRGQVGA
ncbi:MAG TPA: YifB family Mg chelatase-like AAA ATPase [Ornithinimicrobium sp.]|nr:YifB family Mg chelatase-like AAA ATPase [Ornithinimicrobium sp.]